MARHYLTYACGHEGSVQLHGRSSERESRLRWLAGTDCEDCFRAKRERERAEKSERDAAANRAAGLPALEGSPRQTAWAESIRADLLGELDGDRALLESRQATPRYEERLARLAVARAALVEITSARWFIDHGASGTYGLLRMVDTGELAPRTQDQKADGFDPFGLNELTFPATEVVEVGERMVRLRLVDSGWEGCTAVHPVKMAQQASDGSVTIGFGGDWGIRVDDGARVRRVSAEDFHRDRVHRRAEAGERHYWGTPAYTEGEWNDFDVPEADVSAGEDGPVVVRLVCSRWEGLHFEHPANLVRRHRPGFVTVRFPPDWGFRLLGGKKALRVGGARMHADRAAPLSESGESLAAEPVVWHTAVFHPARVRHGARTQWVEMPPDSPWPYALVHHPDSMCRLSRDGEENLVWRFPDAWTFRARTPDGDTTTVGAEEFCQAVSGWALTVPAPGQYTRTPQDLPPDEDIAVPADLLEDDPLLNPGP